MKTRPPVLSFDDWYAKTYGRTWDEVSGSWGVAEALREFIDRHRDYLAYVADWLNTNA